MDGVRRGVAGANAVVPSEVMVETSKVMAKTLMLRCLRNVVMKRGGKSEGREQRPPFFIKGCEVMDDFGPSIASHGTHIYIYKLPYYKVNFS